MAVRKKSRKKTTARAQRSPGTVTSLSDLVATVRRHGSELSVLRRMAEGVTERLDRGDRRFAAIDLRFIETNKMIGGLTADFQGMFDAAVEEVVAKVGMQSLTLSGQQAALAAQLQGIRDILDLVTQGRLKIVLPEPEGMIHPAEGELVSRPPEKIGGNLGQ